MKRIAVFCLAACMLFAAGCASTDQPSAEDQPVRREVFAMDTAMVLSVYGENADKAAGDAEEEIYRLDSLLSRTNEASKVSLLNSAEGKMVPVGEEICNLIQTAGTYTDLTGGAFDITIAPVVTAWGFTTDHYQVPDQSQLDGLLSCVGMEHVHLSGKSGASSGYENASLDPGTAIDLGGIAKGYAADRVAGIFREQEVPRGIVSLGGNVLAWGSKADGSAWRVGIQDPADPDNADATVGLLELTDSFAVTSGSYERYFEQDGKIYHHIIDPATGYPAESGLVSVTVVADDEAGNGTMCDALSTALFVMGRDKALEFWRSGVCDFEMVLVDQDGHVSVTAGLADRFTAAAEGSYTYETVS